MKQPATQPLAGPPLPTLLIGSKSDVGRVRRENQDHFGAFDVPAGQLLVVADGMGGHAAGAVASRIAVEELKEAVETSEETAPVPLLRQALIATSRAIYERGQADDALRGMGTTIVLALVRRG